MISRYVEFEKISLVIKILENCFDVHKKLVFPRHYFYPTPGDHDRQWQYEQADSFLAPRQDLQGPPRLKANAADQNAEGEEQGV